MPYEDWARLSDKRERRPSQAYEEYCVAMEDEFRQQEGHAQLSDHLAKAISNLPQLTSFRTYPNIASV
jgi:hypothetical protein